MYGQRIKEIRKENNLNQTQLGEILNVNQRTISQYENETRDLSTSIIIEICKHFNISADYLLGIDKDIDIKNEFEYTDGTHTIKHKIY